MYAITDPGSLAIFIFLVSLFVSLVTTPLVRGLARHVGLVDRPDGGRKIHKAPTPVAGGLAMLFACIVALVLAYLYSPEVRYLFRNDATKLFGLLAASIMICVLGVIDDFAILRGRYKLLGQMVVVGLVIAMGVRVDNFSIFGTRVELGYLAVPFTAFWLLGAINSLNLLDGMDGMLGTIALVVSLAFALVAAVHGQWLAMCVALALSGSLLGFLRFNFPPASIFLGDSGSMLIGLTIGVLAIQSSLKAQATISLATPLAILVLPILDTLAAIIRRKLTGRSIYATDRGHLHHCLMNKGISHHRILFTVSGLCLVAVMGTLASLWFHSEMFAVLSALTVVWILVATRVFGYVEYILIKKQMALTVQRFLPMRLGRREAHELEIHLQGSADWKELWRRLTSTAVDLGLSFVKLDVNLPALHEGYHATWTKRKGAENEDHVWRLELPLSQSHRVVGRIIVAGAKDTDVFLKLAKLAALLEDFELAVNSLAVSPRTNDATVKDALPALALASK
jgi:UDP-GlcNAc:undecaprenyl-phosphate GlcNAc-1-phosphate transferase